MRPYNHIMNQAFHLYRLQQIDTQIDQANAGLAEINRLLSNDVTIQSAREVAEETDKKLRIEQQKLKQIEFAVKEQQIKINQSESTLYGGKVRNPKELQDLQKEIASLKKHLGVLEDQQLEAMVSVEGCLEDEQKAQVLLSKTQAEFCEKSSGWLGQKDVLSRTLERLNAEKAPLLPTISPECLKTYDNLRKRKSGVAVTSAKNGSCTVCGANIRPMELQAARVAQDLVYCSNCGRILYVG